MDELQHPFESSIAADHESEPVRQSQLLDSSLYSDKTIPEFDEQDYQSKSIQCEVSMVHISTRIQ